MKLFLSIVHLCLGYSRQDSSSEWQEQPDAYLWSKHTDSILCGEDKAPMNLISFFFF